VSNRPAVTLIELLVVLFVLGLTSALVAPALVFPDHPDPPPHDRLMATAVDLAAAREETVRLAVDPDGRWRITGAGGSELDGGRLSELRGGGFRLLVSAVGTCGAEPGAEPPFDWDPLTCVPR
jgi:hypothetical protein